MTGSQACQYGDRRAVPRLQEARDTEGCVALVAERALTGLRAEHPVFRRRRFFTGEIAANGLPDVAWLSAGGKAMSEEDWTAANVDPLAVFLNGHGIAEPGARGEAIEDDSFLILFNPTAEEAAVTLPDATYGERWSVVLDTGDAPTAGKREAGSPHAVGARSLVLLTHG